MLQFKDILVREDHIPATSQKQHTYEEIMEVLDKKKQDESAQKVVSADKIELLSEQSDLIFRFIEDIQMNHEGFGENLTYTDVYNILKNHITVERVPCDVETDDLPQFDDENEPFIIKS